MEIIGRALTTAFNEFGWGASEPLTANVTCVWAFKMIEVETL
jgi:hypothetical protein